MVFDILNQYNKLVYPRINFTKDEFYFFLHMPKTAGTTFRHILYNHIDQNDIFPSRKSLEKKLSGKYLSAADLIRDFDMEKFHRQYHIVCGHYSIKMQNHFALQPKVITFLREPFQRTVSHLKHLKLNKEEYKDHSLVDIWHDTKHNLSNFQSRRLGYVPEKNNRDAFLKQFDNIFFVGLTERFDQSIIRLNRLTNWQLNTINHMNKTPPTSSILPQHIEAEIKESLKIDFQIYRQARRKK